MAQGDSPANSGWQLNPKLDNLQEDHLYHIGLTHARRDDKLKSMFGDVKFVCFGGSSTRMESFARLMTNKPIGDETNPKNLAAKTDRYVVYKAGPVLSVSHGIGTPSLSVIFEEIVKLLYYAGCKREDLTFLRLGTCGGIGVEGGTVIISDRVVDGAMKPTYRTLVMGRAIDRPAVVVQYLVQHLLNRSKNIDLVMGKAIDRPADVDQDLVKDLLKCSENIDAFETITGTTMSADDFYEGQGRIDGAFCEHEEQDKQKWLHNIYSQGVRNMEMECVGFIAMCNRANVKGAVLNVALLNRFEGDGVTTDKQMLSEWQKNPQTLAAKFIRDSLNSSK